METYSPRQMNRWPHNVCLALNCFDSMKDTYKLNRNIQRSAFNSHFSKPKHNYTIYDIRHTPTRMWNRNLKREHNQNKCFDLNPPSPFSLVLVLGEILEKITWRINRITFPQETYKMYIFDSGLEVVMFPAVFDCGRR